MANRRTGKIARLPLEQRRRVNEMLRDGKKAKAIIEWIHGQDARATINEQNVTAWFQGGYQDWLKEQERLDDMRAKREFAMEIARENEGTRIHEAGLHTAASQIFEMLNDLDIEGIKDRLKEDPENYSRIIGALSKISKQALDFRKYKDACEKAQVELQKLRNPKEALSDEERRAIVDKVDEILGVK